MEPMEGLWKGDGVPLWTDRQTGVKTLPSSHTTCVGGKNGNVRILI